MIRFLAAAAILAATLVPAFGQQPEISDTAPMTAVTWSYDSVRGAMVATPAAPFFIPGHFAAQAARPAASPVTTYTGTVDITVTVRLISAAPKGTTINCSGGIGLQYNVLRVSGAGSVSSGGILQTSESNNAVISGKTATCSLAIPYSWSVPASSSSTFVSVGGITGSVNLFSSSPAGGVGVLRSTQVELTGPATITINEGTIPLTASTVL